MPDGLYNAIEPCDIFGFVVYISKGIPYATLECNPGEHWVIGKIHDPIQLIGTNPGKAIFKKSPPRATRRDPAKPTRQSAHGSLRAR